MERTGVRFVCVRILALASVERRAVFRSHPYRLFLPVAVLLVLAAPALVLFAFDERPEMVTQLGLSTAEVFAILLGLAAAAGSVAADRETRRQELVLSRSVDPLLWLVGKWVGILVPMAAAVAAIGIVHIANVLLTTGIPNGVAPVLLALLVALFAGALSTAVALACSVLLPPASAFLLGLLFLLSGQALVLLPSSVFAQVLSCLLPRTPDLNLSSEAAFGVLPLSVVGFVILHALAYAVFCLGAGAILVRTTRR